jgi:5-oxoprolinase (ATP-hydrolysing)
VRSLEPMTAAMLSGRRRVPSHGMAGGLPGAVGREWVERVHGACVQLDGADKTETTVGDVFAIETPGGDGYGTPE